MRRATLILALGLATFVSIAPAPRDATARPKEEETPASWEKRYRKADVYAVKEYGKLAKWCDGHALEWTASYVRRRGFLFDPDNEDLREAFGYGRLPEGGWIQDEIRKEQFRALVDEDDPISGKYPGFIKKANDRVAKKYKSLAAKAAKMAAEAEDAALAATWKELAKRAWLTVIEAADDEGKLALNAHKKLDHPKIGDRYVLPFAVPYLESRNARKQAGAELAAKTYDLAKAEAAGYIVDAGIGQTFAVQTEHFRVQTTHNEAMTERLGQWSERTLEDIIERYGFPDVVAQRLPINIFDVVQADDGKGQFKKYLEIGAKMQKAQVTKILKYFGGTGAGGRTYVHTHNDDKGADDAISHRAGHSVVNAAFGLALQDLGGRLGFSQPRPESWLSETVAYDGTRRLMNSSLTTCGTFGRYGQNMTPKPGQDLWMLLARRQVEIDDDVPIGQLWSLDINDLRGPETVKGYALVQFLFEHDSALAQKFIWHALAHGTPAAVVDVYGDWLGTPEPAADDAEVARGPKSLFAKPEYQAAMRELDRRYREWVIRTWR